MPDKVFHLLAGRLAKSFRTAEVGGIGFDQCGIKLMLADDLTEAVATRTLGPPYPLPFADCTGCLFGPPEFGEGSANDPISSTEQMPIPYALRSARLTARVSATRISAPCTRAETF